MGCFVAVLTDLLLSGLARTLVPELTVSSAPTLFECGYVITLVLIGVLVGVRYYLRTSVVPPKELCAQCGYNLTGNVSGVCPECGSPVMVRTADSAGAVPPTQDSQQV
ncbi:MAG: hypothetical protein AMXMBFR13_14790 [Phycisphaerae bacterium]